MNKRGQREDIARRFDVVARLSGVSLRTVLKVLEATDKVCKHYDCSVQDLLPHPGEAELPPTQEQAYACVYTVRRIEEGI